MRSDLIDMNGWKKNVAHRVGRLGLRAEPHSNSGTLEAWNSGRSENGMMNFLCTKALCLDFQLKHLK